MSPYIVNISNRRNNSLLMNVDASVENKIFIDRKDKRY